MIYITVSFSVLIHEEDEKLVSVSVFEFGGKIPIDCIAEMCTEHDYGGTRDWVCTYATWAARTYISMTKIKFKFVVPLRPNA